MSEVHSRIATGTNFSRIGQDLRKEGHSGERVAAALTQVSLRDKARSKFGSLSQNMLFTRAGLEQASRRIVSHEHAARFHQAGATSIADLGCGIGSESLAFLNAGMQVRAVEINPFTAQIATHNLTSVGSKTPFEVVIGDAQLVGPGTSQAIFLDPARRTSGHRNTERIASPDDYSPSLTLAFNLAASHPTGIKLGPGFERELIPDNAEAQWVSVNGSVVETALWFGKCRRESVGRAALIFVERDGTVQRHELTAPEDAPDVESGRVEEFLYEPDGAVIRARLIGLLAGELNAHMIDPHIAYMTSATHTPTPFAQTLRIIEEVSPREKDLKKQLASRNIGRLEIKKRGVNIDPAVLRTKLRLKGDESATLLMTRIGEQHRAFLTERV